MLDRRQSTPMETIAQTLAIIRRTSGITPVAMPDMTAAPMISIAMMNPQERLESMKFMGPDLPCYTTIGMCRLATGIGSNGAGQTCG